MVTLLQLSAEDLRAEIKSCLIETIAEIKSLPTPEPLPDRITLSEACLLTGFSKSQVYKLTMKGDIPYSKFGKRLVFSRKALLYWMENSTVPASNADEIMDSRLKKSAKKYLKK